MDYSIEVSKAEVRGSLLDHYGGNNHHLMCTTLDEGSALESSLMFDAHTKQFVCFDRSIY